MAELSIKQNRAIAALLSSRTIGDAAKAADVGERTLHTWLANPAFRTALVSAEGDAIDTATRRLIGLQDRAINAIHYVLADPNTAPALRLRAAQTVLDYLLKLRELRNIESRLAALEAAQGKEPA